MAGRRVVRALATDDRRLLWLAGTRALTLAELGAQVGCSANAAAARLSRARRRLARLERS